MASQLTEPLFLSASYGGAPVLINSSNTAAVDTIHQMFGGQEGKQQAVFMEAHNNSSTRVDFVITWNPWSTELGMLNPAAIYYSIGPYADLIISNGLRIGRYDYGGGTFSAGYITAYVVNGSDSDSIALRGYVVQLDEDGVL